MRRASRRLVLPSLLIAALAAPVAVRAAAPAAPASLCAEPKAAFAAIAPAKANLDPAGVQAALDFATSRRALAVRVYRYGCLVGQDRFAQLNAEVPFESFSMAKSVTSMLAGRAVTLGKLGLDDPIGRYIPEADSAHAAITVRQLLTMSTGLHWNFFRDYNLFPVDRVGDALALPFDRRPGTWFEYHQSPVTLLAKVVERAVGSKDLEQWAQAELFGRIGVTDDAWSWERDAKGNVAGYYGIRTVPDTWARLGELLRRNGRWGATQLIAPGYLAAAQASSPANPAYGFLFWLNGSETVIAPTVYSRAVYHHRLIPSAPRDLYMMNGLLQQRVYVIPSLQLVVVRTGVNANNEPDTRASVFTAETGEFEHEFFRILMRAVKDQSVPDPGPYRHTGVVADVDPHYGILHSAQQPEDFQAALEGSAG